MSNLSENNLFNQTDKPVGQLTAFEITQQHLDTPLVSPDHRPYIPATPTTNAVPEDMKTAIEEDITCQQFVLSQMECLTDFLAYEVENNQGYLVAFPHEYWAEKFNAHFNLS